MGNIRSFLGPNDAYGGPNDAYVYPRRMIQVTHFQHFAGESRGRKNPRPENSKNGVAGSRSKYSTSEFEIDRGIVCRA
jgi:hypothetical protein